MAEQYFAKKKYSKAQLIYEDIMPFYKVEKEFEDIYYKYGYCAYYQADYLNAEKSSKPFLSFIPTAQSGGSRLYAGLLLLQAITQARTGPDQYH